METGKNPTPSTHSLGSKLLKRMSLALDDLSPEDTIGFTNGAFWIDVATVEEIRLAALATEGKAAEGQSNPPRTLQFIKRVAALNRDAGEIGAGMLASLVDEANAILQETGTNP